MNETQTKHTNTLQQLKKKNLQQQQQLPPNETRKHQLRPDLLIISDLFIYLLHLI